MLKEEAVTFKRKWLDLSLAQQAIWVDAKLIGSSAYQLGGWVRIAAPIDEQTAAQAISLVMARHDALRLRIDNELPRQWLDESVEPPISFLDLPLGIDPDEAFKNHIEKVFAAPFPLGGGPLFHIYLVRAGDNVNYLLWRFHHLIADSASVSLALSHWFGAYEALSSGTPQDLAPPSSFLATIASDAAYLASARYHKDFGYWSNRFDPIPPPLIADMQVSTGGPRKVPIVAWILEDTAFSDFQLSAQTAGTSVQRALFALFVVTLSSRYGQWDVVSGIALHRRDLMNRHTLGMLAGVMPVRCTIEPFWSLEETVRAFSEQVDADLRHQRMPVGTLSRALGLAGTDRAGLFEVVVSYIPFNQGQGADALPILLGVVDTKQASPISLQVNELAPGAGLAITLAVNTDFLDAGESQNIAALFQAALSQFVKEPETRVEDLPQTSQAEYQLVVEEWNGTEAKFEDGTLDNLFHAQAQSTPQALAIIAQDGREWTYAELDAQSTRLARALAAHGIHPECVVGVRMQRSAETIVALLAILKAGGVYLPLDPAYPPDRLDYMASDAGAALVIDSIHNLEGEANLPCLNDPSRLAYIIYTSGTTGLPKGVAVEHAPPVNLAFARRACHDPLGPGDRVLAAISVGFDVSIGQLLLPLLCGATIVIAGDLKTISAAEFWAFLAQQRVSHINSVPSFFDSILDAAPAAGTLALKRLMLGGEALSGALVARIVHTLPGVEVVNIYGPTEACIDATYHVATAGNFSAAVLPIGRPLSNYQAYVLDSRLQPVGVGVAGELYLGGAGLARGYVNAPTLTAERFLANPFSTNAAERMYRTGDRARWNSQGQIEFHGRVDQQVKIRGFRVEPGEIAAALLGHSAVGQAVVVAQNSRSDGQMRLVAYVVPRPGGSIPEPAAFGSFLASRLPEYMVPFAFVAIAAIPLNANGKLDEKALPKLREGEYLAPRTPTEETIAGLFAEVLRLERCGATDHFFELGGHSLLATTLVSRLRNFEITVPLRTIFETPTVEALARRIDNSLPAMLSAKPLVSEPRPTDIPLSFSQERIWFLDQLRNDSSYNIPIAFELRGKFDCDAARRAMEQIAARHEILRTLIVLRDGTPVQEIQPVAPLRMSFADLSALDDSSQESALQEHLRNLAKHPFDLSSDLPFQLQLIKLAVERHVFAIVIHHVAFDGWSAGIFFNEFAIFYSAAVQKIAAQLPSLQIQFADYSVWQRQQSWDADLAFWLEELQGAPAQLELPALTGKISGATQSSGVVPLELDRALHTALLKVARENGATLFMLLHAAFAILLSRWSGKDDVVIGTVTANRRRGELEAIIGCFVNTLALRTKLIAGESFTQLLARVKNIDLAAFAHQDLPFEQLVEALHPVRSLQTTPIFQVMLVLQNAPIPLVQLPGLTLQPIGVEVEAAKFDLSLNLAEYEGDLTGSIEFAADRFEAEAMGRFAKHLRRILEAIVLQPSQAIAQIDLLYAGGSLRPPPLPGGSAQ
jgi:amino acid adenylation domain-containing protein